VVYQVTLVQQIGFGRGRLAVDVLPTTATWSCLASLSRRIRACKREEGTWFLFYSNPLVSGDETLSVELLASYQAVLASTLTTNANRWRVKLSILEV